ncbi:hypothetical protein HHI36_005307 [Cryptolaemus montrouzieri]|uniref:RNase H type-1 domain-containing protein n=1 Tax=Cryptolaemus montrouzieri TaxID=559131 RepID=A0ABD2NTZ7_9CUCU
MLLRNVNETPPWTSKLQPALIPKIKKNPDNPIKTRTIFYEAMSKYWNYERVFTDASKINGNSDCSIVALGDEYSFNLPGSLSIFNCEAIAIQEAVIVVAKGIPRNCIILSDSLSVLVALHNDNSKNHAIQNIIEIYNDTATGIETEK